MYTWLVATVLVVPVFSLQGNITSFTHSPRGILAPGTMVTYNCQAVGSDVTWFINGVRRDESYSDFTISIEPISGLQHWNITLYTFALKENNNTEIVCYANGRISGQVDREDVILIVAGPPLPPGVTYEVMAEGTLLNVSWEKPYSPEGFPITSYNLTLHRDNASSILLWEDTPSPAFSIINSTDYRGNCILFNFTATASNSLGTSKEGFAETGFPIFSQRDSFVIWSRFSTIEEEDVVILEFQAPEVCDYQHPGNYTLELVKVGSQEVTTRGPQEIPPRPVVMETFIIDPHHSYEARLHIIQNHFSGQVLLRKTIIGNDAMSTVGTVDGSSHDLLIISMVSLGVALLLCVALAVTIVTVCGCKKGIHRRPTMSEHIEIPLQTSPGFELAPAPKGKGNGPPTSLPPMSLNPIYEGGPLYDSPGGESFDLLLGSPTTIPGTPMGGKNVPMSPGTPMSDNCRYFNMPPSLPPPRVTTRVPQVNTGAESNGLVQGEYTEMKPLSCAVPCPPNVPPAVYEAMGGEYETIRK